MRLLDIRLKNYRCFADLHLDLRGLFLLDGDKSQSGRGGVAVLVAPNGKGKTAILDGIKYLLASFIARFKDVKTPGPKDSDFRREWFFDNSGKVHEKATAPYMRFEATAEFPDKNINLLAGERRLATWDITRLRDKSTTTRGLVPSGKALGEINSVADLFIDGDSNDQPLPLPILAYYNTERAVVRKRPERRRAFQKVFKRTEAYVEALDGGLNYKKLIEWLCYVEDKLWAERQQRRDFDYVSLEEKTIQKAIDGLLPGFSNLKVTKNPLNLAVDVNEHGVIKTCFVDEQLSDGYRIVLVLALNLVSRILEANGEMPNATPESLLSSDGIVLIDEIDLHLHPSWQQRIVGDLNRTFPNIQFIVTTHSPQVVSSVPKECLRVISDTGIVPLSQPTQGVEVSDILRGIFGTSPAPQNLEIVNKLNRLIALTSGGRGDTMEWRMLYDELVCYYGEEYGPLKGAVMHKDFLEKLKQERTDA